MEPQAELFEGLPRAVDPSRKFESFSLPGGKIVQVPYSVWKDGRKRLDLTALGGGIITSRNPEIADQQAIEELRQIFQSRNACIREHDERAIEVARKLIPRVRAKPKNQRLRKKALKAITPTAYVSPFPKKENDTDWHFARCPDWLNRRPNRQVRPSIKLIYGRLSFPSVKFCKRYFELSGAAVIERLDQEKLGAELGMSRTTVNTDLVKMQDLGLVQCIGSAGAKADLLFPWHEWMPPETCKHCLQVLDGKPVIIDDKTCRQSAQESVVIADKSCKQGAQVSLAIKKRETEREKREQSQSPSPWYSRVCTDQRKK